MSYTQHLISYKWENINIYVFNEREWCRFVEGVFWMARKGVFCPESMEYEIRFIGKADRRLADWADKGIWYKMLDHFANNPDKRIYQDGLHNPEGSCLRKKTNN